MDKEDIRLDTTYTCQSFLLTNDFLGKVIAIYENTCVMELQSCASEDTQKALEYNNRFVIPIKQLIDQLNTEKPAVKV